MQFNNKKKLDRGDHIFSVGGRQKEGVSRQRAVLEQTAWSKHYTFHRGCVDKTWPLAVGQKVHCLKCQVLASGGFQQDGSASNPLWSKTGYKQIYNFFFNQKATGLAQLFFPLVLLPTRLCLLKPCYQADLPTSQPILCSSRRRASMETGFYYDSRL